MEKKAAKPRKFKKLRARLSELEFTQHELAGEIKRCPTYVDLRMEGKRDWTLDDIHKTMKALGIPKDQMHEYFPMGGVAK